MTRLDRFVSMQSLRDRVQNSCPLAAVKKSIWGTRYFLSSPLPSPSSWKIAIRGWCACTTMPVTRFSFFPFFFFAAERRNEREERGNENSRLTWVASGKRKNSPRNASSRSWKHVFWLRHASTIPHQSLSIYLFFFFFSLLIFLINVTIRWIFQILKISIQILFQKGLFNRRNIEYHFFFFNYFLRIIQNFSDVFHQKKKYKIILQHGRFIFVFEPWKMKWYKSHFCYIYVLFQYYILYQFIRISFHFKFNLTGFSNSTGLSSLFDTPTTGSKFQIYNFIIEELKFIIIEIKNWIKNIYIYTKIFRIKFIKEFTKFIIL